jgi:hypothetical protein
VTEFHSSLVIIFIVATGIKLVNCNDRCHFASYSAAPFLHSLCLTSVLAALLNFLPRG